MTLKSRFITFVTTLVGFVRSPVIAALRPYFSDEECARLFVANASHGRAIDLQTWKDLLIDVYYQRLADDASIFGKQALYAQLRAGGEPQSRAATIETVQSLLTNKASLDTIYEALSSTRNVDTELVDLLFSEGPVAVPTWAKIPYAFSITLPVAIGIAIISPISWLATSALAISVLLILVLFSLHMRYDSAVALMSPRASALTALLMAVAALGQLDIPELNKFRKHVKSARRVASKLNRIQPPGDFFIAVRQYSDWFNLAAVRHYFKQTVCIDKYRSELRQILCDYAVLEANVILTRHLLASETYCWAKFREKGLKLTNAVNPLIETSDPLSVEVTTRGIFLTGKNGVGKSTLLRTIGLNAIVARSFGFCYSAGAHVSDFSVYASMKNEDSLEDSESLYVSEIRRARELLEIGDAAPRLFLIDEIFRGTNFLESAAASVAFLTALSERGLVVVSSHNSILGAILQAIFSCEHVTKDEHSGRILLRKGIAKETNGISLLRDHGFGEEICLRAEDVFRHLSVHLSEVHGSVAQLLSESKLETA